MKTIKPLMEKKKEVHVNVEEQGEVTEIWVSLDVKISKNYQSIGTTVGMKASLKPGQTVSATLAMLDSRVEKAVQQKIPKIIAELERLG